MTAKPARRTAAALAAALLSVAAVVTTAPPAVAATTPHVVREVVTTVKWASIEVVDAEFHQRRMVVRLTRAFTVDRVAVTETTPVRPQLTPAARPAQDRTAGFARVFEQ